MKRFLVITALVLSFHTMNSMNKTLLEDKDSAEKKKQAAEATTAYYLKEYVFGAFDGKGCLEEDKKPNANEFKKEINYWERH